MTIGVTGAGNAVNLTGSLNTSGANNGAGAGFAAGSVLVTAADGTIATNTITATGGSGTGAAGGAAGTVTLRVTEADAAGRNITAGGLIDTTGYNSSTCCRLMGWNDKVDLHMTDTIREDHLRRLGRRAGLAFRFVD